MNVGIVGYGAYIPRYRITVKEIADVWGHDVKKIESSLRLSEKSVVSCDEDSATMGVACAKHALERACINKKDICALYIGSESHPYAVKPTSTIVGQALGIGSDFMTADIEFACKGGTAALQVCYGFVRAGMVDYSLAIGTDVAQAKPGDLLEYSAAAGSASFILGSFEKEILATIDATCSVTSDTPDFWRRPSQKYPEHTNRFTGEPSYFKHTIAATEKILKQTGLKKTDFSHVIFHQPNGKFPRIAAKKLGFTNEQIKLGLVVDYIGNTYSASSLLGLTNVLDIAKPNQKILLVSYGSGAGSDAFIFTTTENILEKQKKSMTTKKYIDTKEYISYKKMVTT